ncbi:MAG: SHOCT domain-containing protein [Janthinobacterium lividum]
MRTLSTEGQHQIADLASRHGFSTAAVMSMLEAVIAGHGGMAQFNHAEFGGSGQWMNGGMTMVSDMFNNDLKNRVDALCTDLAALVQKQPDLARVNPRNVQTQSQFSQDGSEDHGSKQQTRHHGEDGHQSKGNVAGDPAQDDAAHGNSLFAAGSNDTGNWWPAKLGQPDSSGSQNATRYAWFSGAHRLAIMTHGTVKVYDTLDHQIGGVSQQQSGGSTLAFTSQHGVIKLDSLPQVDADESAASAAKKPESQHAQAPSHQASQAAASSNGGTPAHHAGQSSSHGAPASADVFMLIEKLADLRTKGLLNEDEFLAKKTELLGRL